MADGKEGKIDAFDSAVQDAVNSAIKAKAAKYFAGFILLIGAAGSTLVGTGGLERAARPDPATGTELRRLETRILKMEVNFEAEKDDCMEWRRMLMTNIENLMNAMEWNLRKDMPPGATKARIRACERWIESTDLTWEPPTLEWQ